VGIDGEKCCKKDPRNSGGRYCALGEDTWALSHINFPYLFYFNEFILPFALWMEQNITPIEIPSLFYYPS